MSNHESSRVEGRSTKMPLFFKYKNSKFDSSVTYFRSVDSKIPFTNAARAPLMN